MWRALQLYFKVARVKQGYPFLLNESQIAYGWRRPVWMCVKTVKILPMCYAVEIYSPRSDTEP